VAKSLNQLQYMLLHLQLLDQDNKWCVLIIMLPFLELPMQKLRPTMHHAWSFDIVAVRPGLQIVQQLRHVTGQPLS
jgi:hypothetical protein